MLNSEQWLEITKGNAEAALFLASFVQYCHMLDDVLDADKPIDDIRLVETSLGLIEHIMLNPWARERYGQLWPLIVVGANAWLDSNRWEKSEERKLRRDSDVVKGVYHEIIFFTAYLCGGWNHLRAMSVKYREYNHDHLWARAEETVPLTTSGS